MSIQTVEINTPDSFAVVEVRQGPVGPSGTTGAVAINSETTSDGTADLSVLNITAETAEITESATIESLSCQEFDAGNANFQASALGNVTFGSSASVNFNATAYNYAIGGAAAAAHRTALGVGTADSPTFGGADFFTSTTTTLNVYNILSGDNFERLSFRWASNVARIGTAKGGTGSARDLVLETDGTERVRVSGDGSALSIAVGTNRTLTINQADGLSTNGSIITTANVFANGVFSAQSTSTNSQFTNRNGLGITVKAGTTGTGGFVGIGTTNPTSKLSVFSGDIEAETIGNGIILKSPNGNRWRVTVDNTGALVTTAL